MPAKKSTKPETKKKAVVVDDSQYNDDWDEADNALGGAGDIITCKKDQTNLHLVSGRVRHGYVHYVDMGDYFKRVVCLGGKEGKGNAPSICPLCYILDIAETTDSTVVKAAAKKIQEASTRHKYFLEGVEGEIKKKKFIPFSTKASPVEVGPMIYKGISRVRADINDDLDGAWEEMGVTSILQVLMRVTRTKEKNFTSYAVSVLPKLVPVPEDIVNDVNLDRFLELPTAEETAEILKELKVSKFVKDVGNEKWDEDLEEESDDNESEELEEDEAKEEIADDEESEEVEDGDEESTEEDTEGTDELDDFDFDEDEL